jgi:hypothetical protein
VEIPGGVGRNYEYISFRFLQDGSTNLSPAGGTANGNWYVTVLNAVDKGKQPAEINFFTLQVDPVSGATRSYRPNAG